MKQLQESSNNFIVRSLIAERMSDLNVYAPLYQRLQEIYNEVDREIMEEEVKAGKL